MGILTMKFGGASVGTTPALTQVISIVLQEFERWDHVIVVVSALDGVTDALIEATHLAQLSNRRGYRRIVATIRTRHLSLVEQLPLGTGERSALQADVDKLLFDMLDRLQAIGEPATENVASETLDAIVSVGERLAARIVAALLRHNRLRGVAIDAPDIIISDSTFGNAEPDMQETRTRVKQHLIPVLQSNIIPVITGYIAGTTTGKLTTLGREGSDYSASILSVCTQADELWMWTDVDGMMSADPREIVNARVIPEISYDEVAELALFGARIVHTRMIGPLREHKIPVRIKNVFRPQEIGTLIHDVPPSKTPGLTKAVTSIQGVALSAPHSGPVFAIAQLVSGVLEQITGNPGDVMITTQSSGRSFICFVIPTTTGPETVHTVVDVLREKVSETPQFTSWHVMPVSIITTVGSMLNHYPQTTAAILAALEDTAILAVSQGASLCSVSIVVEPQATEAVLRRIHTQILSNDPDSGQAPKL